VLQVEGDTQSLQHGGEDAAKSFPPQHRNSGNNGVLEDDGKCKENCSITDASQGGYAKIHRQLVQARSVENIVIPTGREVPVHQREREQHAGAKQHDGHQGSCKKLADYQQLATQWGEKRVVERALHHLSAKQPCEDSHDAEEYSKAHVIKLEGG